MKSLVSLYLEIFKMKCVSLFDLNFNVKVQKYGFVTSVDQRRLLLPSEDFKCQNHDNASSFWANNSPFSSVLISFENSHSTSCKLVYFKLIVATLKEKHIIIYS